MGVCFVLKIQAKFYFLRCEKKVKLVLSISSLKVKDGKLLDRKAYGKFWESQEVGFGCFEFEMPQVRGDGEWATVSSF